MMLSSITKNRLTYHVILDVIHINYLDLQTERTMQQQLKTQLKLTKQYCSQIESNFTNNLLVIEQREQEIQTLTLELQKLNQQTRLLKQQIEQINDNTDMQVRLVRNQYMNKLQQKQQEHSELLMMMETRTRKQIENMAQKYHLQLKNMKNQLLDREQSNHRILHDNNKHIEMIKQLKTQLFDYQNQIQKLNAQKNAFNNKMALHEQELEGIKTCNQNWEENLKNKLRESQKQKQILEQEISQIKLAYKQKIKKQKQQFGKKILHLSQEKQIFSRELLHQNKQLKYKHQNFTFQIKNLQKQIDIVRQQRQKLQKQNLKLRQSQRKTNFQKNQKEYQYILKIFQQQKRDLKNQIDVLNDEKKRMKDEFDEMNVKRQNGQKIIEKLKYQLINKSKETDELKKDIRKNKIQFEGKLRQIDALRPVPNNNPSVGIDMIQSAKIDNDYSKLFSEDIGPIDERFFMDNSPYKSPKNKNISNFNPNRDAQLMKKISQLQLQMQEYKTLTKKLKEQAQNMKKHYQQQKNRQINIYKDKANLYWQKCNDKQQQLMDMKQHYSDLKTNYSQLQFQIKRFKDNQNHIKSQIQQTQHLKEKIKQLQMQRQKMDKQLQLVSNQRDMLEDVATELKASYNSLKGFLDFKQNQSRYSEDISPITNHQLDITEPNYQPRMEEVQTRYQHQKKVPKKLHDLIRQKKAFSISGKKVLLEQRNTEVKLSHVGTDSQKQILQKIKIKNKTPPKVVNYAELKKQKDRKASVIETASQKQVFQRLKNKQNQNSRQSHSPQKVINFLELQQQYKKSLQNKNQY